jgi:competence protein ComEC
VILDIGALKTSDGWRKASGKALVTIVGAREDLRAGQFVEAAGSLARVAGPLNPGEFDYRAYLRAQGVRLRLSVDSPAGVWVGVDSVGLTRADWLGNLVARWLGTARAWSRETLAQAIDPPAAPLAEALLLGKREGVDPNLNDAFARTGTSHLLAISGLHMQVLALAVGRLLLVLGLSRRATFAAVATATVAYTALVGLMPSVVRSAAMTVTYCVAGLYDRRSQPANTLALAALATLGLNPAHLFDVGCQLSFLAVTVIVWGVGPISRAVLPLRPADPLTALERRFEPRWRTRLRSFASAAAQGVVLSTLVWLAAVPLVALKFHLVSPIGIVLNIPLIPLTSIALLASGLSLGLSAIWGPLGRPAGWISAWLLEVTGDVVRYSASLPFGHAFVPEPWWAWVLGFYVLMALAAAAWIGRWPRRTIASVSLAGWVALGAGLAIAPILFARPGNPPKAEVLAVGHGLAVVIETGGGRGVLYDCGRMRDPSVGRRIVAPALWARGVRTLDAVILSHADADHYDGLPDLLDRVPIGTVIVPEGFSSSTNPGAGALLDLVRLRGIPVKTVSAGETWDVGLTRFAIRHPPRGWNRSAPDNARSIVLDVSWSGRHALFTGDLEGPGLAALVEQPREGPIDVLLAPHHGGRTANPSWLYSWATPALVVASQRPVPAGSGDPLAHLQDLGTNVRRTWQRGAVRLAWDVHGIKATAYLDLESPSKP